MLPQTLIVLAPIRSGEETRLRDVLRPIGDDIRGQAPGRSGCARIEFTNSRHIHFARFALLLDPDRGAGRTRLLYSATYDGELEDHVTEMVSITSDMDAIWGCCEGYTGRGNFISFIRAHAFEPEAFYIAFRDETVASIHDAIACRRQAQLLADVVPALSPEEILTRLSSGASGSAPVTGGGVLGRAARPSADTLHRLIRAAPIVGDVFRVIRHCGFTNVVRSARQMTASLDRYPLVRWVNRITANRMPQRRSLYSSVSLDNAAALSPLGPGDELPLAPSSQVSSAFREDAVTQNQLTLVTVVKPGQVDRVRAVMAAIDAYARRLASPGSLLGVSTIHFVKWLVIDDGRRLMMVSDYDGSWESYIDEFAEMILSGLDAIWDTAYGYPPDGARDVPAFKKFLRTHQVPSEIFFSAYPEETIVNLASDLTLARACGGAAHDRLREALQRL